MQDGQAESSFRTQVFPASGVSAACLAENDRSSRRPLLRFCLDWSEQQHHLAGRHLGAYLLSAFIGAGWITRTQGQRAVRLTDTGRHGLHARLGLNLPDA